MKMKKIIILLSFISILLCSCNQQANNNEISNEPQKNIENGTEEDEADYSKLHELALMYEKYAWGYGLDDYSHILYATGLLVDLNKQENFLDDDYTITIPFEDTKEISSLFMSGEPSESSYTGTHAYPISKYPNISLEPFEVNNTNEQINILYGRFIIDEHGNKHWLYPVKYTAVPYVLSEEDIPEILSDILISGEQMYRIINVENIYDMDLVKSIYSANGYSKLFEEKSYDLASPEDLVKMSERVNSGLYNEIHASYNLICDIDMSGVEFVPMGKYSDYTVNYDHRVHNRLGFCGVFNGNNHSISNLSILKEYEVSLNMENLIGFFSILGQEASVKDLCIINANIDYTGENASIAGILAGRMYGSNVENCSVSGTVKGTANVGGFAGIAESGDSLNGDKIKCIIADCHADVEVYGENWLGGFIGSNSADISNCSVKGIVTCDEIISNKGPSTPENMPFGIGGFTGFNSKQIINSGADVWVKTMVNVKWVGSFIGYNQGSAYECFYNSSVSHWDPVGLFLNDFDKNGIKDLPNEEYYTRLSSLNFH